MPPRKPTEPTSISAFFLGGLIPKERVGDVLEMLYLTGASNFQIDPQFDRPEPKPRLALAERALRQLALPAPSNGATPPTPNGQLTTQKAYLLNMLSDGPRSREDIYAQAALAGYDKTQMRMRLWELRRDNILKEAQGVFSLRKGAAAPAEKTAPPTGERPPSLRHYLIELLSEMSLSRDDIYTIAAQKGFDDKNTVGTRLWELTRDKIVKFAKSTGLYSARKGALRATKPANGAAQKAVATRGTAQMPSPDSQEGLVLAEMRRIHPDSITRSNLMDMFTRLRRRPESVSVALTSLFKKGLAKHAVDTSGKPIPATYEYIPQPTPKDQSHGHQHPAE